MFRSDRKFATALAPASVGNVAVGFDLLGHALQGAGDWVTARLSEQPGVRILEVTGCVTELPNDVAKNTAGAAVIAMLAGLLDGPASDSSGVGCKTEVGVELSIHKGIPMSSGMGGSAASAVAAVVALNALLAEPLPILKLYPYALAGEVVASGGWHGDNVAASLLGGLTLCHQNPKKLPLRLAVPGQLRCVLIHPDIQIRTAEARAILPREVPLSTAVGQNANLAWLLAGCQSGRLDWIRGALVDLMIEPHRRALIPGFEAVKQAALDHGALGCSISGAGPSVFAWFAADSQPLATTLDRGTIAGLAMNPESAADAMVAAFDRHQVVATALISPVDCPGVQVLPT
ncbi:MAG: homoserine kinase [Planctomycetes bacterium]|nr:homoserine kinase [Planctomycetota bacterium]